MVGANSVGAMRVLGELADRVRVALKAGLQYGGERDLYTTLGYPTSIELRSYRDRYERGDIAARIVDAFPRATWKAGTQVLDDEDPKVETVFEEEFRKLDKRLKIWASLCRVDILAGIGRYAVLLIGAPGELETELPATLRPEDILYLQPYSEQDAKIDTWDDDPASERFGKPVLYSINCLGKGRRNATKKVHFSRVLHVADGTLDDEIYGQPRLRPVWNRLNDLDKVLGGGAEAFWLRANQGLVINIDPQATFTAEQETQSQEKVDEFVHNMRRFLALRGAEAKMLGSDVANFEKPADILLTVIAGTTEIPKRILMGSERGELASTQDKTNWDERIDERRQQFAEPYVIRPLVDLFVERKVLPEPQDGEYDIAWPDIYEMDEVTKADLAVKWATLKEKKIVRANEVRDKVLGLEIAPELDEDPFGLEAAKALTDQLTGNGGEGGDGGDDPPVPPKSGDKKDEDEEDDEEDED